MENLLKEISLYVRSRYPIIYLVTSEENRAEKLVKGVSDLTKKQCFFWTFTDGFYSTDKFGSSVSTSGKLAIVGTPEEDGGWAVQRSGEYPLTAQVVTVKYDQRLNLSLNDLEYEIAIEMPFTVGYWQESQPVKLTLDASENTQRFWRDQPPQ